MRKWIAKHEMFALLVGLILISAVVYLPFIRQIGYLYDDWYLMYAAKAYGPLAFIDIFSVDRPARALVMIPAYILFGDNPLYYNLSAYAWRVISAFCFLWLLRMLWPRQRFETFLASLLFLIYPGFLSQLNGIDYQSQMVSLAAAMFSIALSVRASLESWAGRRILLIVLAALFGWLYLGLVEYFIGFEYLRAISLLLPFLWNSDAWKEKLISAGKRYLPHAFIPFAFLLWRVFFFSSERKATNIFYQLGGVLQSPLMVPLRWLSKLATETLDVLFLAWGVPFSRLYPLLRPEHVLIALGASSLVLFVLWRFFSYWVGNFSEESKSPNWEKEILTVGGGMILAGLIPVIMVNREVDFINFSRYALASATGVGILVAAAVTHFSQQWLRWTILSALIAISVFTHYGNATLAYLYTKDAREFWWQVSWRVPNFQEGTTLVANYPMGNIQEDYFVWGPANLIYRPSPSSNKGGMRPSLYAWIFTDNGVRNRILAGQSQTYNRKKIIVYPNAQTLLVLSRPSANSCVHLLNGSQLELSASEPSGIIVIAPFSRLERVILDGPAHMPSPTIFGPEPPHGWCFFYEKADLARQRGDWEKVIQLGEQAFEQGLKAEDPIEWMPFLQAYAQRGNLARLLDIKDKMKNADPWVMQQVCQRLSSLPEISPQTQEFVRTSFCTP
jgi:uncharacterized membrane protein